MIINNINIIAFGKLKDFNIDFSQNLNVIYGDMESGQDTIVQFIKMVFYGSPSIDENSDTLTNDRLKYCPYDDFNSQMGGSIDFYFNDILYRIVRIFKTSNATDEISLFNLTENVQLDIGDEKKVGKLFFDINEKMFDRTVFIQDLSPNSNDEKPTQKILNLISSYDENISADVVKIRLKIAKETYLSKSGKIGILDKNRETLTSLYEDINTAQAEESQKIQMQIEYEAVEDNRDEIIARYDELRKTLAIQQTMTEVNNLKNTVSKLDYLNDLKEEIKKRKVALSNEKVSVNEDFLKTAQLKMNSIQQIGEMKNQYQSNVSRVKSELDALKETANTSYVEEHRLYDEAVEQIEFTNGHITNLRKAIENKKKEHEKLTENIKNADIEFRVIDEQVKAKKQLDQQRLDMAQQQLVDARQPVVNTNVRADSKTFIVWGAIIIGLGILLTLTINPWCVIVIGMGIIMAIINLFDKHQDSKKGSAKHARIDEVAVSKANENIQKVRHDIEIEQYSITKKQREAKKQLNMLKLNEEQVIAEIEKYQEQIKILKKNLEYWENQKKETQAVFAEEKNTLDKKQNELDTLLENISNSEENLCNAQNDIINFMSAFKPCSTLTEVSNMIASLHSELEYIKTLQNKADYQEELLKTETNGHSYDELKEKLTDVTADFIEMCGKDNPEPMSISELAKLNAEIDDCQFSLNMQNADLTYINTDMRSKFRNRTCVTEIEHNINHIEREVVKQEKFCHSLDLAFETLQQSIEEIKEYNDTLNESTKYIFNQIADNTYESLAITKTLDMATQFDSSLNNWKYLSKGTLEQACLSLRVSIAQIVSNNYDGNPLPIILDDTFIQYDIESILKSLNFISEYSKTAQILLFTCHKNIFDIIKEKNVSATLIELV